MQVSNDLLVIEATTPIPCPFCGGKPDAKAGFARGLQRYLCRRCNLFYTKVTKKTKKRHFRHTQEGKKFAVKMFEDGYFIPTILREYAERFGRSLERQSLFHWCSQAGIPLRRPSTTFNRLLEAANDKQECPLCSFTAKMLRRGFTTNHEQIYQCRQCGCCFTKNHICGIPKYSQELKELAINLYVTNPDATLGSVAKLLNDRYRWVPPLSYDSIGRWVEEKGLMKSKAECARLRWKKRREQYGKAGLSDTKRKKLSEWRKNLWKDPNYRANVCQAIRHSKASLNDDNQSRACSLDNKP